MASSLLNGERAVVALFVGRVVFSLPLSLLPHGLALSLLAISALVLDVVADSSAALLSRFHTRPGASSGILLGAVTLPTVMISKMIQLSRAFSLDQVAYQGSEAALKLSWMLCHGLAVVKLIQHVFRTFPSCASVGEACLVASGLVLYFGDMLAYTIAKVSGFLIKSDMVQYGSKTSEINIIIQPKFLDLAFGAALAVFLALEIVRVWRIWPLGQFVHKFMSAFTDHRDSDLLIVSHFSLLLGCALPIWLSSGNNDRPLSPFSGILSLGIGDTMASVVGHKYGVLRWSKTGKKTIEGTAAGITSVLAACSVLLPLLASTGYIVTEHWISILVAVTVSGLLEAYTAQLDNAFIPLVFYSLLCL
ncbi:hypothetical protein ACLB2K_007632 [Fragaria x ananassa]